MSIAATSIKAIVAALAITVATLTPAAADTRPDLTNPAFAPTLGPTSIPIGHAEFCKSHRDECGAYANLAEATALSDERWQQLISVNNRVNVEIVPVTDEDQYKVGELWAYPQGAGDCEDFALAKRRGLIEQGWDPSTLLMTVVRERNGNGHAVLLVRTDRGDLVLDNQDGMIRLWSETNYQFVKRQSQTNAGEWVQIDDTRPVTSVGSTR